LHIMGKFFTPFNPNELPSTKGKLSGEWTIWFIKGWSRFSKRDDARYWV
jgi:hypothetical protein